MHFRLTRHVRKLNEQRQHKKKLFAVKMQHHIPAFDDVKNIWSRARSLEVTDSKHVIGRKGSRRRYNGWIMSASKLLTQKRSLRQAPSSSHSIQSRRLLGQMHIRKR